MRILLLPLALLLAGCDFVDELTQRSAPAHLYAQALPMDTAGGVRHASSFVRLVSYGSDGRPAGERS